VTGLSFASALDLRDRGVPANDLEVFRFSEHGCNPYGQAIIVNPAFAEAHPEAVAGFLRALVGGLKQTVRDPATAADAVLNVMDSGSHDLELNRLKTAIRENIVTDEVKRNGLGGISRDRFEASTDQIGQDFKFSKRPMLTDIFDSKFLPPVDDRATD
jgi:NitT/TauT family transport system substrate-binding protein